MHKSSTVLLLALMLGSTQVSFAQVSNVEGLTPLEGVAITKLMQQQVINPGAAFKDCDDCPEMVWIPAGQFIMGASPGEDELENLPKEFQYESQPQHPVKLKRFAAGKFSVKKKQYQVFVTATGRISDRCQMLTDKLSYDSTKNWRNPGFAQDERHPVVCISWDDAIAYVQWLSQKTGKSYRLLSEAEWEYAARAGTVTYRYWGDDRNMACAYANGADQTVKAQLPGASNWNVATCNDGYAYTAPVGSFQPNPFGLYDMLGNSAQWTQDCVNQNYIGAPSDGSAWMSGDCSQRVLRGGGWGYTPKHIRSAIRIWSKTFSNNNVTGFRVARDN